MLPNYAQLSIYLKENRLDDGRKAYREALEVDNRNGTLWCWLSVIEERLANHEEALIAAKEAYSLSPDNPAVVRQMIVAAKNGGRPLDAKSLYKKAQKRWPNDKDLKALSSKDGMAEIMR